MSTRRGFLGALAGLVAVPSAVGALVRTPPKPVGSGVEGIPSDMRAVERQIAEAIHRKSGIMPLSVSLTVERRERWLILSVAACHPNNMTTSIQNRHIHDEITDRSSRWSEIGYQLAKSAHEIGREWSR